MEGRSGRGVNLGKRGREGSRGRVINGGVGTRSGAFNTDMSGFTSAVNETLMELQG